MIMFIACLPFAKHTVNVRQMVRMQRGVYYMGEGRHQVYLVVEIKGIKKSCRE